MGGQVGVSDIKECAIFQLQTIEVDGMCTTMMKSFVCKDYYPTMKNPDVYFSSFIDGEMINVINLVISPELKKLEII